MEVYQVAYKTGLLYATCVYSFPLTKTKDSNVGPTVQLF